MFLVLLGSKNNHYCSHDNIEANKIVFNSYLKSFSNLVKIQRPKFNDSI